MKTWDQDYRRLSRACRKQFWQTIWFLLGLAFILAFMAVCFLGCSASGSAKARSVSPPNPMLVSSGARKAMPAAAKSIEVPCRTNEVQMDWALANPVLTNPVPHSWSLPSGTEKFLRFQWIAKSNVAYQVQFAHDAAGPWFAIINILRTNDEAYTHDFPIYCGKNRFVRVMQ